MGVVHCIVFGPAQLAELADGPTGCGELARGWCSLAWNFSVTRSSVLTVEDRRVRRNTTLSLHQ
jgi:hypothetical protein